jgi:hypothetical protein
MRFVPGMVDCFASLAMTGGTGTQKEPSPLCFVAIFILFSFLP